VESIGQVGQRARRRDATGRARRDYHKDTATLAVRVPVNLADQVKRQAKADGMSVNAWLLALIERELAS
jgi:predicted HicB family RNase H-like nuclease